MNDYLNVEVVKLPAVVCGSSMIGVGSQRPTSWGNYFYLKGKARVVNMWAENMEHLVNTNVLEDGMIEGWLYTTERGKFFLVDDQRIPVEYMYNKLCFTGSSGVSFQIASHMFGIVGDPDNELEQWTDPISYCAKRGSSYNPKTGIITTKVVAKSRKLKGIYVKI